MTLYVIILALGLIVGSFLNVCIYRIPRDLSIIIPSSRCPSCNNAIKAYDNIPLISFLLLGGKCRYCKAGISLRYPFVESVNALFYALVIWRFGIGWHTVFLFAFCSAMIVITFIDLDFQIIPDAITLPGTAIGLIAGSLVLPDPFARSSMLGFKDAFIGFISGGVLFYLIAVASHAIFKQEAMGGGDIKMMAMVGSFLGWKSIFPTTFTGSFLGAVIGIFLIAFKGKGRHARIPFGPFLAVGAIISLFCGQEMLAVYLRR